MTPSRSTWGFGVFKLAESNFKTWDASKAEDAAQLEKQLELHVDHHARRPHGAGLALRNPAQERIPLTAPVETADARPARLCYSVAGGALLICLERELTLELIRAMADQKPERVVCLDEGFAGNDQLKANAVRPSRPRASLVSDGLGLHEAPVRRQPALPARRDCGRHRPFDGQPQGAPEFSVIKMGGGRRAIRRPGAQRTGRRQPVAAR